MFHILFESLYLHICNKALFKKNEKEIHLVVDLIFVTLYTHTHIHTVHLCVCLYMCIYVYINICIYINYITTPTTTTTTAAAAAAAIYFITCILSFSNLTEDENVSLKLH